MGQVGKITSTQPYTSRYISPGATLSILYTERKDMSRENLWQLKLDLASCDKVFVYGTLKQGYSNHYLLSSSKQDTSEAYVDGILHNGWGFPCMQPYRRSEGFCVKGEVYTVDLETLDNLDALEGHPDFFYRTQVDVCYVPYKSRVPRGRAWAYFLYHNNPEFQDKEGVIEWN
jgi:gamma-glutamylaminecyclotransferase